MMAWWACTCQLACVRGVLLYDAYLAAHGAALLVYGSIDGVVPPECLATVDLKKTQENEAW